MPANLPPTGSKVPLKSTNRGFNTATFYSGAVAPGLTCAPGSFATGSDVFVASGPGRLDTIVLDMGQSASGQLVQINFYDAHQPVSGGPIYASGHKLLYSLPATTLAGNGLSLSGLQGPLYGYNGQVIEIGTVFGSGLCFNSRSGQVGFTATWCPEMPNQ